MALGRLGQVEHHRLAGPPAVLAAHPADPAELDPEAAANGLKPGDPVFDKVVVITDRRNLDTQLRETVGSFEQTAGLVVKIDEKHGAKSEQLAQALSQQTGKIVTVTLQTFPALVDYLKRNPTEIAGRRFAIIVDEAHSSQSGDAATAVQGRAARPRPGRRLRRGGRDQRTGRREADARGRGRTRQAAATCPSSPSPPRPRPRRWSCSARSDAATAST